jgi:anti-sigma B factor antagonist
MSDLTIIERQVDGVVFVDLDGKILLGESNRQLHDAVRLLVQEGKKNVVLNLESVTRIDSSGLGELIASFATLEKNGGKLKLMKMPSRVTELMTITKLLTVFDIFENEDDACASFDLTKDKTTGPLNQSTPQRLVSGGSLL